VTDPTRVHGGYDGELRVLPPEVSAALAAGVDTNPVGAERLREYWTTGEGGRRIRWGTEGAFTRCTRLLREYMPAPGQAEGYCNLLTKRATGSYAGEGKSSAPGPL